ncbi:hypothetical protein EVAR_101979_1 [Eumeta japonica]|uniref:Uncharacterized protein n=1 Tax=Eumeta variegata TaxID=151549 RepID=A0A4C1TSH7_EUMVA|nr:hypothetical protein EVAR_101979_1 [Eumeta japonica]
MCSKRSNKIVSLAVLGAHSDDPATCKLPTTPAVKRKPAGYRTPGAAQRSSRSLDGIEERSAAGEDNISEDRILCTFPTQLVAEKYPTDSILKRMTKSPDEVGAPKKRSTKTKRSTRPAQITLSRIDAAESTLYGSAVSSDSEGNDGVDKSVSLAASKIGQEVLAIVAYLDLWLTETELEVAKFNLEISKVKSQAGIPTVGEGGVQTSCVKGMSYTGALKIGKSIPPNHCRAPGGLVLAIYAENTEKIKTAEET